MFLENVAQRPGKIFVVNPVETHVEVVIRGGLREKASVSNWQASRQSAHTACNLALLHLDSSNTA